MSRTTRRSTKSFRIGAPPQCALRSRDIWSTPHRHPSIITSMSQPNPCLSHSPNSRIKRSIHKSPCSFRFLTTLCNHSGSSHALGSHPFKKADLRHASSLSARCVLLRLGQLHKLGEDPPKVAGLESDQLHHPVARYRRIPALCGNRFPVHVV